MFDKDIRISGIYATHLKSLARNPQNPSRPYLFDRYIDVYMNAAVLGLIKGVPITKPDFSSKDTAMIFAAAFIGEHSNCVFLYRLVMLLDQTSGLSPQERVDRAFRDDVDDKHPEKLENNMKLFHSYVYAGIEYLYKQIAEGATNVEALCDNAYKMMQVSQDIRSTGSAEEYLQKMSKKMANY